MRKTTLTALIAVALLGPGSLLAGCGGDDSDPAGATVTDTVSETDGSTGTNGTGTVGDTTGGTGTDGDEDDSGSGGSGSG